MRALAISLIRLFVCYLPLLYIGSLWGGINGLIGGAAAGNLVAGFIAWKTFKAGFNRARAG